MRIRTFVSMVLFFISCTAVLAADRTIWKHDLGTFSLAKGVKWIESDASGNTTFHFKETARTPEYVELFDAKRKMTLRLKDKNALVRNEGDKGFTKLYSGGWVDK